MKLNDADVRLAISTTLFGYAKTLECAGLSEQEVINSLLSTVCTMASASEDPRVLPWTVGVMRSNAQKLEGEDV